VPGRASVTPDASQHHLGASVLSDS